MTDNQEKLNLFSDKIDQLSKRQETISKEIIELRTEINQLSKSINPNFIPTPELNDIQDINKIKVELKTTEPPYQKIIEKKIEVKNEKSNIEKFIGENLINKIGIAITVIGVAIGAKYAIEHQMLSPLTRIVISYLFGLGLIAFAIKLKSTYENYSAVLLSGAMAILYIVSFLACSLYHLFPLPIAFSLMICFTLFTVIAALTYNKEAIAIIGMVGAYAVPFLLSNNSGNVQFLFIYMFIINTGILIIAFIRYWKILYYSSFAITWIIFLSWFGSSYIMTKHFQMAIIFLTTFYLMFYTTFLVYKLIKKEKFDVFNISLLLLNSFLFFGIGYAIFSENKNTEQFVGLYTLCNAIIHFIVGVIIYKNKLADRNLFYLVIGLVLLFITIAIPIQLNGNWVTLIWTGEAAILFYIGRTRNVVYYEYLSYPLIIVSFFSLVQDWSVIIDAFGYSEKNIEITAFYNVGFLVALLCNGAYYFINYINQQTKYISPLANGKGFSPIISFSIPAIFLITLYYTFRMEIDIYFRLQYILSKVEVKEIGNVDYLNTHWNYTIKYFKQIWIINYTLFFLILMSIANIKKIKRFDFAVVNLGLNAIGIFFFLTQGLLVLSQLRGDFLMQESHSYYQKSEFQIWIRYLSIFLISVLMYVSYIYIKQDFIKKNLKITFDFFLHITGIWVLSSEFIHWMDMAQSNESYKLGLSIIWGCYALLLIILGIWHRKKYLRIAAISLFFLTLLKLFFYDLSSLNTLSKTIVFISLGILLLIISFLYNKYKHIISVGDEK